MSSLIDLVRSKFQDLIRSVNPPGRWKVVVVDDFTQSLLGVTLKQYDILQENVVSIENIGNRREQQPQEAIYILMPTTQNIDRIVADFSNGRQQYGAAHLFFIDALSDSLERKLTQSPAGAHLKTLRDLFPNFIPTEAQAFTLKCPGTFFNMFTPITNQNTAKIMKARLEEELRFIAKSIFNVCVSLDENPYIRYYMPSHHAPLGPLVPPPPTPRAAESGGRWRTNLARGNEFRDQDDAENNYLCRVLAFMVQDELEDFKKSNPDFGKDSSRGRATLIITDRSMDTLSPLVHEFTYQAMCNDLLNIKDGISYNYKFQNAAGDEEDKTATLNDADTVYTSVRHMHMKEAIDKLMVDFNTFMKENAGFKGEGAVSLNDMKDMLANLPQYQEQREAFSLHLNMAQECMSIFEKHKLPSAAKVEQDCATGMTAEGKSPKTVVEDMIPILDMRDISNSIKARIIALYIQHRDGVPDEDRRRLYQHAKLPVADQDAINSLVHLGVRLSRASGDRDTKKRLKPKKAQIDEEYELSRYKPLLHTVLEDHVTNKLDISVFPYVKDSPTTGTAGKGPTTPQPVTSLRSAKPSWHRAARTGSTNEARQRVIVFVAGGVTYSEMRTAYQLSNSLNKDIYVGSTHNITPQTFLEDLRVLELGGIGSRHLPKGLPITGPDTVRHFQTCYDQKYFTKEAAPPPRPATAPVSQSLAPPGSVSSQGSNKLTRPPPSPSGHSSTSSLNSAFGIMKLGSGGDEKKDKKKHRFF